MSRQGHPEDHVAFTLQNALDYYECGWSTWEQLEEELRQASAYYYWLYGAREDEGAG